MAKVEKRFHCAYFPPIILRSSVPIIPNYYYIFTTAGISAGKIVPISDMWSISGQIHKQKIPGVLKLLRINHTNPQLVFTEAMPYTFMLDTMLYNESASNNQTRTAD